MTLTVIDTHLALVIVDLQEGLRGVDSVDPMDHVISQAVALAEAFRAAGQPVVLVNAAGRAPGRVDQARPASSTPPANWTDIVHELGPEDTDLLVTKYTWGAFHATDLHAQLQARAVTQVVLAGVATSVGVETTARAAYEHGYNVVLATDAMTDLSLEAHRHSIDTIFPKLGETTTTAELTAALSS
jgi:nicotinamidase-related amidase